MNLGPLQEQQVLLTLRHLSSPELHAFDEKCLAHVATDALGEVWQGGRVHVSLFHEVGRLDPAKSTCGSRKELCCCRSQGLETQSGV